MSRRSACALLPLALVAASCGDSGPPTSFGLNVTVTTTTLDSGTRAAITSALLSVRGDAEPYARPIDIVGPLRDGEARFRYIPKVRTGALTLQLDVADADGVALASGESAPTVVTDGAVPVSVALVAAPPPPPPPPKSSDGVACTANDECASERCIDGVCCATACDGVCSSCAVDGHVGTCFPIPAGARPYAGHGDCGKQPASTCANDGTCDGAGACRRWPSGTECRAANCDPLTLASTAPATCDGSGACVVPAPVSCGAYVCKDASSCHTSCTTGNNTPCAAGLVCANNSCQSPSCMDGVRSDPETGVDCGGGSCPKCGTGIGCKVGSDCQSGTCASNGSCTAPTYTWRTSAFGTCSAGACSVGTQTRSVWCERSDGTRVADALCSGATRPTETQSCTNTNGCSWFAGSYGSCSVKCGGGVATRPVYCRDGLGNQVSNSWCTGAAPPSSISCNTFPCVINVVGEPSAAMGPCWSPPNCLAGYPAVPSCPVGYAPTRTEQACGNPNACGTNWALCTFYQVKHYGCSDPTFVMGIVARECTYQ